MTTDVIPAPGGQRPSRPLAPSFPAARNTRREGWRRRAPLLPALIFTIIVTQVPFLVTIWYSLNSWNLVRPGSERFVGLANYADVFADRVFRQAALNTVAITAGCVIASMILGVALALLLDRTFVGRSVVRTLIITPFLVMPVAGALVWKTTMLDPLFGVVNAVLSPFGVGDMDWASSLPLLSVITALVWQWTPFMALLVLAGLQSQEREVIEAAQVDGASPSRIFRSMTLPHLRRYIELGVLLGAIYVVNTFDQIYIMTQGGPGTASANLPFYIYQRAFLGFDVGQAAAMGVLVVAGTIVVALFALRMLFRTFAEES
ncbi:sugar ABC transporter permease [Actinobacteria bacterium YIM 96077]|uniref:Sugar ABC transporter permease n=1 Tax=Phytoactinopolyspora halophila TaxID=1981511 RepID=A0A329QKN5_9ACTN|nr:sugar ABC transporter permease [Phytoactinopolyspora halophila]AYY13494.1 sugar ABC transporter permease [Actinobacteria bacterium YIM 96077]RAW12451.1 sugar ABC transporter permease [Phytoactinopolyspora halophila]